LKGGGTKKKLDKTEETNLGNDLKEERGDEEFVEARVKGCFGGPEGATQRWRQTKECNSEASRGYLERGKKQDERVKHP